jgi:hypothetical protein
MRPGYFEKARPQNERDENSGEKMKKSLLVSAALCLVLLLGIAPAPAQAPQQATVYTYVAEWGVPRAQWGDLAKVNESTQAIAERLVDDGTLVGYGYYVYLLHTEEGMTHGNWFQATSLGNILKARDELGKIAGASAVLAASRHRDFLNQSTLYGFRPGATHNGYLWIGHFAIKPDHVGDWSRLFGTFIRPALDELVADGTVVAYQLDTQVVHTVNGANTLSYAYVTAAPEGIDKVRAAINAAEAKNTAIAGAIGPLEESTGHYDILARVGIMRRK